MALAVRADTLINKHALSHGITPAGLIWLKKALDPFADLNTEIVGYPDTCNNPAVNQRIKLSYTIGAPAGLATPTWDCNICVLPWINPLFLNLQSGAVPLLNYFPNDGAVGQPIGGLTVFRGPNGAALTYNQCSGNSGGFNLTSFQLPPAYYQGSCRATTLGFEVRNTTSVLNLQGALIVYRQPIPDYETSSSVIFGTPAVSSFGYNDIIIMPHPPVSQANAMILCGSRKWEAKEGCYIPLTLNSNSIPIQNELFVSPVLYTDTATNQFYTPFRTSTVNGLNFYPDNFWTKFNTSGCYLTGLSPQTTLDIEIIIDIERFPSEADSQLVVLATPSPKYDPVALQIYSHIVQDMPPGVMVRENGLGDWLMSCAERIRDVVMPVIRPLAAVNPKVGALVGFHDLVTGSKRDKQGKGMVATGAAWEKPGQNRPKNKNKSKPKVIKEVIISNQAPKAPAFNAQAYAKKGNPRANNKPKNPKTFDWSAIARAIQK